MLFMGFVSLANYYDWMCTALCLKATFHNFNNILIWARKLYNFVFYFGIMDVASSRTEYIRNINKVAE